MVYLPTFSDQINESPVTVINKIVGGKNYVGDEESKICLINIIPIQNQYKDIFHHLRMVPSLFLE